MILAVSSSGGRSLPPHIWRACRLSSDTTLFTVNCFSVEWHNNSCTNCPAGLEKNSAHSSGPHEPTHTPHFAPVFSLESVTFCLFGTPVCVRLLLRLHGLNICQRREKGRFQPYARQGLGKCVGTDGTTFQSSVNSTERISVSVERCFVPLRKLTRVYRSRLTFGEQPVSRWITGVSSDHGSSVVLMVTVAERFKWIRTETSQVDRSLVLSENSQICLREAEEDAESYLYFYINFDASLIS